jgi:hypothetical protein
MTMHRALARRLTPLGVALVALVATVGGCARPGTGQGPGGEGTPARTYTADDVVLRVEYTGGFVPVESMITRVPLISVYGDGRVITEGPVLAIYPGPALPNLQVQTIDPVDVVDIAARALAAGVGGKNDLGQPPVADAASTRFTVLSDAGPQVTEVYALEMTDASDGLSADQRKGREALRNFHADLTDLPRILGPDAVSESKPYQADAVAVISRPWTEPGDADLGAQPEMAWPGPALPGAPASEFGLSCATVTGADATAVLAAAASANVLTPWVSEGARWSVNFRPLLPDEASCDDLS